MKKKSFPIFKVSNVKATKGQNVRWEIDLGLEGAGKATVVCL